MEQFVAKIQSITEKYINDFYGHCVERAYEAISRKEIKRELKTLTNKVKKNLKLEN